jgi:uncharacterized surface protein with fasciclin (FAS1) repeats
MSDATTVRPPRVRGALAGENATVYLIDQVLEPTG